MRLRDTERWPPCSPQTMAVVEGNENGVAASARSVAPFAPTARKNSCPHANGRVLRNLRLPPVCTIYAGGTPIAVALLVWRRFENPTWPVGQMPQRTRVAPVSDCLLPL